MYDILTIFIFLGIILFITIVIAHFCSKKYEAALFLIVLSPWISALLVPNSAMGAVEQGGGIGGYLRISLVGLIGFVGFFQYMKLRMLNSDKFPRQFLLLAIYLMLALFSISYSLDQKYTAIKSISFIPFYFFLIGLYYWIRNESYLDMALNTCFLAVTICLILNALSIVVLPEKAWWYASEKRFQGLWGHPNSMGAFCMASYPIFLWKYSQSNNRQKWVTITLFAICAILHLLSGSRTSLIGAFLGIITWNIILKKYKQLLILMGAIFILSIPLITIQYAVPSLNREKSSNVTDLTGRPEIWSAAIVLACERPILGYGYSVNGKIFEDFRFYDGRLNLWSGNPRASLHNGYLSVFVGLGSLGLIVYFISLYFPLVMGLKAYSSEIKACVITIMTMSLVVNWCETSIVGEASIDSVIFWVFWVIAGRLVMLDVKSQQIDLGQIESVKLLK